MARMHTRRKGQAGSTKPIRTEPPKWSNTNKDEIENTIQQLGFGGNASSKIGMILRDRYGVPDVTLVTGKKIVTDIERKEYYSKSSGRHS